jgi:hypothetical protein
MPEICRFYGIIIYIFYQEHNPPHFHAVYGEHEALITIQDLAVFSGYLPGRALGLVIEWASLHKEELKKDWDKAVNHEKLEKIEPLK